MKSLSEENPSSRIDIAAGTVVVVAAPPREGEGKGKRREVEWGSESRVQGFAWGSEVGKYGGKCPNFDDWVWESAW